MVGHAVFFGLKLILQKQTKLVFTLDSVSASDTYLPFLSQAHVETSAGSVSTGNIATTGRLPERLECKGPLNEPHHPQV